MSRERRPDKAKPGRPRENPAMAGARENELHEILTVAS